MLRVVNLERLKKLYATFSLPRLLEEYGIEDDELAPLPDNPNVLITNKDHFTPLWYYDNIEFDSRNPDEWLKKDTNGINFPVPAIVYLPTNSNEAFSETYDWINANVIDYNSKLKMYSVVISNNNSTKVYTEIPRIQIHFKGEDPREFVKRIKYAILRRKNCEDIYKWSMYLNKVIIAKNSKYISEALPDDRIKQILRLIYNNQKINKMNKDKHIIVQQINNIYQESCLSYRLQLLKSMTEDHHNTLKVPNFTFELFTRKPSRLSKTLMSSNQAFINSIKEFNRKKLLELPEVFTALCETSAENSLIKDTSLLFTVFPVAVTLKEFETIQLKNIFETFNLLKNYWIKEITFKCYESLKSLKNCWFDIAASNIKTYESSINKLRKLMTLIKYMMEERLRSIVINSAKRYATLIEQPCIPMKSINDDFVWGSDLNKSPFEECAPPLFSIILNMNENGAYYSIDLDKFEPVIMSLFERVILESHEIPAIHPYLLTNLKFAEKPYLTSIGLLETKITELKSAVENSIRLSIILLKAYCREFHIHSRLFNTDVESYVKKFFDGNPSLSRIKEEISMQITLKLQLEKTIPETITIGLFVIHIESLKHVLIRKRIDLADLTMKTHASLTTEKIEICCAEYNRMYLRLFEIPTSIEQVFEIKKWIDTSPMLISKQSEIVRRLFEDMEMLDVFLWILDDEQLRLKYVSQIWPYKIQLRISESLQSIETYIEQFEKIQFEDELLLQDNLEYLTSVILKLNIENNLSKVNEIAVEVNKNWKLIEDLKLTGQTLNRRQKLFGHTITPFDNVDQLLNEFEPYKTLWLSALEFYKLQNACMQNPLANIEKSTIESLLNNLLNIITKSVEQFAEIPVILSVAKEIKTQIEEFMPIINLLKDILTQGIQQRHWDAFFEKTGVKIILSPTLNFKKCLALGVQNYIEEVKQMSDNASKEYTIEIALNKMMDEWKSVKLQFLPYNDKDMYISTISDKELQMLDEHILITKQLSLSSYKGIFEGPLTKWEDELRLSNDVIKEWIEFQKKWMYLKAIFDDPSIKDQLSVENKKLNLVERIRERIMKIVFNKPWVMKTCPDKRLLKQLINGNIQLNKIHKPVMMSLFERVILESHEIPAIHPYLITDLKFTEKPYLTLIGLLETKITELKSAFENSIRLSIILLKAYCREFHIHLRLFNTDVESYVKKFFDGNPSLSRIKEEISMQITLKLQLEKTIPETITIGLFVIHIESLKHVLIRKRIDLADLTMKTHASLTTEKIEICCAEYNRMYLRLFEIPTSIEQVFEIKKWIDTSPMLISKQSEIVRRLFEDMEMLDVFLWILDDEQLRLKYVSQIWPYKIQLRISKSLQNIETYIEQFQKIQFEDDILLQDNLEYLTSVIIIQF